MRRRSLVYFLPLLGFTSIFLYCEFLVYYIVQFHCKWPSLNYSTSPVKAMILADTHLLGSKKGHWFDKLRREWQMHRAFQTAITLHRPEVVFVLGDLLDEGSFCSDKEFEYYIERFYSLFKTPSDVTLYAIVGNHDIGFHYRIHPHLKTRFEEGFNSSAVEFLTIKNTHFVLLNSMALEGDGCFLCKPAETALKRIETDLKCAQSLSCNSSISQYSRPILMQHYPLFRESDSDCHGPDAAPIEIKEIPFKEKWDCLSREATNQILHQLKPRLVLSGHTHHGCTRSLPIGEGVEITIPSFSWRNKDNPNYALAVFDMDNYEITKCDMPKESTVINCYMAGVGGLIMMIFICKLFRTMSHR